ncbi:MAG TPA: NAD-dependent epimerase/dehydratase family protein, partial [Rhodospirillales bacterium]|nr:NAD-dependent epimerase/dehydratase family protein [Rhodospirillales bacterium]
RETGLGRRSSGNGRGIQANRSRPAEFIYDNLSIETNIIHGAKNIGVEKLLFLGSSCIYPKMPPSIFP